MFLYLTLFHTYIVLAIWVTCDLSTYLQQLVLIWHITIKCTQDRLVFTAIWRGKEGGNVYLHLQKRKLELREVVIYLKSHTCKQQRTCVLVCSPQSSFAFLLSYSVCNENYNEKSVLLASFLPPFLPPSLPPSLPPFFIFHSKEMII